MMGKNLNYVSFLVRGFIYIIVISFLQCNKTTDESLIGSKPMDSSAVNEKVFEESDKKTKKIISQFIASLESSEIQIPNEENKKYILGLGKVNENFKEKLKDLEIESELIKKYLRIKKINFELDRKPSPFSECVQTSPNPKKEKNNSTNQKVSQKREESQADFAKECKAKQVELLKEISDLLENPNPIKEEINDNKEEEIAIEKNSIIIFFFLVGFLILGNGMYYYFSNKRNSELFLKISTENNAKINELNEELRKYKIKILNREKDLENKILQSEKIHIENQDISRNIDRTSSFTSQVLPPANSIIGYVPIPSDDGTILETKIRADRNREYYYIRKKDDQYYLILFEGSKLEALQNTDMILEPACEIAGDRYGKSSLEILAPGKLHKTANGFRLIQKIKVRIS